MKQELESVLKLSKQYIKLCKTCIYMLEQDLKYTKIYLAESRQYCNYQRKSIALHGEYLEQIKEFEFIVNLTAKDLKMTADAKKQSTANLLIAKIVYLFSQC